MVKKVYSSTGRKCRVTFELQPEGEVQIAHVCGDFNDWNTASHPLKRRKDGTFTTMLWLHTAHQYHFRYLLDGERWANDQGADGYAPNPFGGEDSVVAV
jgi:1,4-alpha-glucan branching enzyme